VAAAALGGQGRVGDRVQAAGRADEQAWGAGQGSTTGFCSSTCSCCKPAPIAWLPARGIMTSIRHTSSVLPCRPAAMRPHLRHPPLEPLPVVRCHVLGVGQERVPQAIPEVVRQVLEPVCVWRGAVGDEREQQCEVQLAPGVDLISQVVFTVTGATCWLDLAAINRQSSLLAGEG
jgi:hypothetical protein